MSLEDLGNIGEFVGAIAVVVSLIYLALQIRQNTRSVRASTFQSVADSWSEFNSTIASDPELTRIYSTALFEGHSLSQADSLRLNFILMTATRLFESAFFQWQSGVITDAQWSGFRTSVVLALASPGGRAWWETRRLLFTEEFRDFMQRELPTGRTPEGT